MFKWKEESTYVVNFIIKEITTATSAYSNHHPDQSAATNIEAAEGSGDG